jgi:alkanesulfonate monooxygenase SsuD/methylene tetrahydromethanopterin reductase-like flavin-dependent oxidoreductase (luciferase family)
MKLGLHISDFTWDGGPTALRRQLGDVAVRAEQAGYDRISVMDHVWQIAHLGPPEHEMLEAYTALGFLAAKTERVKLLTVVTAVVYREPGLLAKAVTTLDVLSGGRAMLGIGAAWNQEESRGLGLFFRVGVRAVGGGAAELPADVERRRRPLSRQALPARTDPELTAGPEPSSPADPDRRRR